MINTRLVWFLEKNNILTQYQSGFRKGRTTTDQLIRLESFIRDSFLKGNHVVSVFFDFLINSIADVIPASFEKSLFVDDFSITCSSRNMASIERQLLKENFIQTQH